MAYDQTAEKAAFREWLKTPGIIAMCEFCAERGYGHQRLSEWAAKDLEWVELLDRAKTKHEAAVLRGALVQNERGVAKYNARIAQLILSTHHRYHTAAQSEVKQVSEVNLNVGEDKPANEAGGGSEG